MRQPCTRPLADVGEVGEFGLIESSRRLPRRPRRRVLLGPGDDAAVVAAPDGRVVVTTDVLVQGRALPARLVQRRTTSAGRPPRRTSPTSRRWARCRPALVVGARRPADLPVAWASASPTGSRRSAAAPGRRRRRRPVVARRHRRGRGHRARRPAGARAGAALGRPRRATSSRWPAGSAGRRPGWRVLQARAPGRRGPLVAAHRRPRAAVRRGAGGGRRRGHGDDRRQRRPRRATSGGSPSERRRRRPGLDLLAAWLRRTARAGPAALWDAGNPVAVGARRRRGPPARRDVPGRRRAAGRLVVRSVRCCPRSRDGPGAAGRRAADRPSAGTTSARDGRAPTRRGPARSSRAGPRRESGGSG